jgi:hypothetical protein
MKSAFPVSQETIDLLLAAKSLHAALRQPIDVYQQIAAENLEKAIVNFEQKMKVVDGVICCMESA